MTLGTAKTNSFRARAGRRSFLARCEANDELTGLLQSYEQDDEYYWEGHRDEFQKQRADPDDVFFQARERKQEIKEKNKQLQAGLARQHRPPASKDAAAQKTQADQKKATRLIERA